MPGSNYKLTCSDCSGFALLKKEFQVKNLWLNLGDSGHGRVNWVQGFGTSRFSFLSGLPFLIWRILLGLFTLGVFFASVVIEEVDGDIHSFDYWLWFLTHWAVTIHALYGITLVACTVLTQFVWGEDSQIYLQRVAPRIVQANWILLNMSLVGGLYVLLLNWIMLRPVNPMPMNFIQHGILWAFIVLDFLFGKQPFFLVQGIWVSVLGLCYGIWTLIHYSQGWQNRAGCYCIYNPIQWRTAPGLAVFWSFGSPFVVILPIQALFWAFNFTRIQAIDTDAPLVTDADRGMPISQLSAKVEDKA